MDFTHQGAAWADRKDKLGVDWLGTEAELRAIKSDFDKAASWAKQHDRPLFLGEFGAYDKAPMESRVRYVTSVARAAEQRGWSWAYWQFDSDFILYDIGRDAWIEPIRRALIPAAGPRLPCRPQTPPQPSLENQNETHPSADTAVPHTPCAECLPCRRLRHQCSRGDNNPRSRTSSSSSPMTRATRMSACSAPKVSRRRTSTAWPREGCIFRNFHVAQPVCSASRAGLLTGCYPNRIGIHGALGPALQGRHQQPAK